MIKVSKLITYPFKSARGIELPQTSFDKEGMIHDRRLMAVSEQGIFLTARNHPELLLITCEPTANGWSLSYPGVETLTIAADSDIVLTSKVWEDKIEAINAGSAASEWLSDILGKPVHIALWKPQARHSEKYNLETSFADAAPLLIANEASMQQACDWAGIEYDYRRFRANIVISGAEAFEEENWKRIQIGSATFELLDACERCIMITRDPDTSEAHKKQQPIRALVQNHTNDRRRPIMGVNAKLISPPETVKIALNDHITVL